MDRENGGARTHAHTHSHTHLFPIVSDRGKDGAKCLKAHGDVQKVGSKEEVVIMTQKRHGHVPGQVQEGLWAHTHKDTHITAGNIDYGDR